LPFLRVSVLFCDNLLFAFDCNARSTYTFSLGGLQQKALCQYLVCERCFSLPFELASDLETGAFLWPWSSETRWFSAHKTDLLVFPDAWLARICNFVMEWWLDAWMIWENSEVGGSVCSLIGRLWSSLLLGPVANGL